MEWKELSNEAKNVIEWVENPYTGKKENIEIQVGKNFQRLNGKVDIPMTKKLFSEIIKYVAGDNNLETVSFDANTNIYVFRMKDEYQLH